MRKTHLLLLIILAVMFTCLFTACDRSPKVDDDVTVDNVNSSAENAAHGFNQSIFRGERELFSKVFPREVLFDLYNSSISDLEAGQYYGIKYTSDEVADETNNWDRSMLASEIALNHDIPEDDVGEIRIVKQRVYFEDSNGKYTYTDVFTLVYKYQDAWYALKNQDPDAETN